MSSRVEDGAGMPIGERFVRAIAAKDRQGLLDLLAPHIDFRAMTPSRFWEASSAAEVVDEVILGGLNHPCTGHLPPGKTVPAEGDPGEPCLKPPGHEPH